MYDQKIKGIFTLTDNSVNGFNALQDWFNSIYKRGLTVSDIRSNMLIYCIRYKWQSYLPNFVKRKFLKTIKLSGSLESVAISDSISGLTNTEVIFGYIK